MSATASSPYSSAFRVSSEWEIPSRLPSSQSSKAKLIPTIEGSAVKDVLMLVNSPFGVSKGTELFDFAVSGVLATAKEFLQGITFRSFIETESAVTLPDIVKIDAVFNSLKSLGIKVHRQKEIAAYISEHSDVRDCLYALSQAVMAHFSSKYSVSLEFFQSQSSGDKYPVIYIRSQRYDDEFMDELWSFRESIDHLFSFSSGFINITTDFKAPRESV